MKTQQELFDFLKLLNIQTTTLKHTPLFTCDQKEASEVAHLPGGHVKNLFLKDDHKKLWLVVALDETKIDLKKLGHYLPAKKLRFADENLLMQYLGVKPGSVTPFGLINDIDHVLHVVLDSHLFDQRVINIHPLSNDATTSIAIEDFKKFLAAVGNQVTIVDFEKLNQQI